MLIDAKHKPWVWSVALLTAAAAGVYVPYHLAAPNGPSGGSWIGLAFGVASFLLMLFAGLLGLRRRFPALRVGRPETWLRAHLWLGLLCVPLAFFHAGFRFGGGLTILLMVLLVLVTLSGILGLVLQQILPRLLTTRVPMETIYEQVDHVKEQLLAEADAMVAKAAGSLEIPGPIDKPPVEGSAPLRDFHLGQVRPFLSGRDRRGPLATAHRAALVFTGVRPLLPPTLHETLRDLEVICEEWRQLGTQKKLQRWLHGWLFVHVPLSYALLALGAAHAFMSVRF